MTQPAKSRWLRSEITFGPVGRVVCTVLLIAPILFGIFYSVFFLVAGFIWLFVVPLGLRDIWRAVRDPHAPPPVVVPETPAPLRAGESIHDRKVPRRW